MFSQVSRRIRVYLCIPPLFFAYCYRLDYDRPLFLLGYFCAEIHASKYSAPTVPPLPTAVPSALASQEPTPTGLRDRFLRTSFKKICLYLLFALSVFLLAFPTKDGEHTFGYVFLCKLFPKRTGPFTIRQGMQSYGAILMMPTLLFLPRIQRWFSSPVCQYLGKISFSLYMVHGFVLKALGHRLVLSSWMWVENVGGGDSMRFFVNVFTWGVVIIPVTVWLSDIYMRAWEVPCTNFVRWLEGLVVERVSGVEEGQEDGGVKIS